MSKGMQRRRWGAAVAAITAVVAVAALVPMVKSQAADSSGPYLVGSPWSIVGMNSWEIFWYNSQSGQTKKWYLRHNGVFQQQDVVDENRHLILIGPPWSIAGVGTFGMSQDSDLLWHNSSSNETQIWYLGSEEDSGVPTTYIVGRRFVTDENGNPMIIGLPWTIVAVGDLNGDGTADIVWHNSQNNATQIWFMDPAHDGSQIKLRADVVDENGQEIFIGLPYWSIVGSSDIDGDGRADLVWHNSQTNETQIWFMNGNRIVRRPTVVDESGQPIFIGAPWSIVGSSDIDTDGTGDIVWHNSQTNETQIWFMNGNQIRERKDVVDTEPSPTPSPSPSTSSPPSLPQVHTYTVQNCDSHGTSAGAVFGPSKSVWVNDITANTGFREMAVLQGFPVGELCGTGGSSPQTFVFNATAGHTYELRVIDYAIPPNCTTDSPNGCRPLDVTFQGNAGGQNPVTAVTG
ncbi:MAG TPA: VCBS repeat-containing protein [Streptosporangiaceae bacterium]|nr:VCBS repeat-containing protein [Streptosporangiaceae bacterium]